MRRTLSSIVLVLFTVAVFTPAAMASYTLKHNCCAEALAAQNSAEHCHGMRMNMPMAPHRGMHGMSMSKCGFCSPALTVSSTATKAAKPLPAGVAPAGSDPHPFLTEFAPTNSSQDQSSQLSQRAPPDKQ
jgi:hypothetical protein